MDSFSEISGHWIEELARSRGDVLPVPMWGTLFIPNDPCDVRDIEKLLRDIEPECDDDEEAFFASAGWQEVADTGIWAREFDDKLLLGIQGAGYNFYDHHWEKLYDALGYSWHVED